MKILHVCNWVGGITTRNVAALKRYSRHSHELVVRIDHCYDMATETAHLTEKNTTREIVDGLADEADALHFHAVGYAGSEELRETIHGIDWSRYLGKKLFVLHGMVSYLGDDGNFTRSDGWSNTMAQFDPGDLSRYDALMGPHLSCKISYDKRLEYVPDIVPIHDWLYTPLATEKQNVAATFKDPDVAHACAAAGVMLRMFATPTKLTEQLAWRRANCKATFDNSRDGHWGLFGIESLSQGVPCVAYTHDVNRECWSVLGVPEPPFHLCEYKGADAPALLAKIMSMSTVEWNEESERARGWIEKCYAPELLVKRWDDVYDRIE